ncbi:anti-sigma factor [Shinella kummerowiae]|uniref:Anti-sigma factor n=1 Tax=Shinella kummerowiae TaxID=417745 RepID=A0A6N8SI63_9HYPH|nr:anti-sigma factor [Shinella kummerowiae]MXN48469.1 anti-sigma factor [Shinella kummerowiae]
MSADQNKSIEPDLHAYADGMLDAPARAAVEAYLADNPGAAEEVAGWKRQNESLRVLYDFPAEPVPRRLDVHHIEREIRPATGRSGRMAAAAVLFLTLGAAIGWYGGGRFSTAQPAEIALADEAMKAHRVYSGEVIHPVEVWAGEKAHLKAWLSKRLDRSLAIPDLAASGFTLVGGRLLPSANGPAAQVMYQDETGRRVTLYIVPVKSDREETSFRHAAIGPLEAFVWTDEAISCALVGDVPRDRLLELATLAYKQLE